MPNLPVNDEPIARTHRPGGSDRRRPEAGSDIRTTGVVTGALVVFSLDGQRYALPVDRVQRSLRAVAVTALPGVPAIVLGVVDLAGTVIPVVDIRQRFKHAPRDLRLSDHFVVATTGTRSVALPVDETIGVTERSRENFAPAEEILPGMELVAGAIKLDDGLILIHDLDRLLSLDEERAIDRALNAAAAGNGPMEGAD